MLVCYIRYLGPIFIKSLFSLFRNLHVSRKCRESFVLENPQTIKYLDKMDPNGAESIVTIYIANSSSLG